MPNKCIILRCVDDAQRFHQFVRETRSLILYSNGTLDTGGFQMKIGQAIKERRQALNYTQEQLAEKAQVSRSTISNWETNRNYPDIQMIVDLSNILAISLDALLKGDETVVTHIANDTKQRKKQNLKIKILSSFILILALALLFFYVAHTKVTSITQPQQILNAHMDATKNTSVFDLTKIKRLNFYDEQHTLIKTIKVMPSAL